jgi:hypothetical protein
MLTTLRRLSWQNYFYRQGSVTGVAKMRLAQIIEFLSLAG